MGDYGIKATKPGEDVSSSDITDYVFHSGKGSRSIVLQGSASLTTNATSTMAFVTINHNFGYKPQLKAFVDSVHLDFVEIPTRLEIDGNVNFEAAVCISGGNIPTTVENFVVEITSTTIRIGAEYFIECVIPMFGSTIDYVAKTYDFDYIIFMEEVEL